MPSKMEQSRLEPVALASPLTVPPQGQELLDPVLRESTGKRIQKKSLKPSGNLQSVNTRERLRSPRFRAGIDLESKQGCWVKKKIIVNLLDVRPL